MTNSFHYKRQYIIDNILQDQKDFPQKLLMLWGARQSGKSTLVNQMLKDYHYPYKYIDADAFQPESKKYLFEFSYLKEVSKEGRLAQWMILNWENARSESKKSGKPFFLVIDEVQKIDNWSGIIKGLQGEDRREGHQVYCLLLGSSPHALQKGLSDAMNGRYFKIRHPHWSYTDMSKAFNFSLDEYIYYGGYPEVASIIDKPGKFEKYIKDTIVGLNLHRDVLSKIEIERKDLMTSILTYGAKHSGQILSYPKLIKNLDAGANKSLIIWYLFILNEIFVMRGLYNFTGNSFSSKGGVKLQVLNNGILSGLQEKSFAEIRSSSIKWGRFVESAVGAHLINSSDEYNNIGYWRDCVLVGKDKNKKDKIDIEVDFVVMKGSKLTAIEVKSVPVEPKDYYGLNTFKKRFPECSKTIMIGDGGDISLEDFFSSSAQDVIDNL